MSEESIIQNTPYPRTRDSLAEDLRKLGLQPGMVVIAHASLSSLGWINGGAVALIQALMDALTPEGTLVMPAHSGEYSDPALWSNPPVPESWWETIRQTMPAFDPRYTPTRGIGRLPEAFRSFPGVLRSNHPSASFAAWGKHSVFITCEHSLDFCMGEGSPLARLYDLDGWILLLGVGYDRNTSQHLGENRSRVRKETTLGAPIQEDGQRKWITLRDIEEDSDRFPEIGEVFEREHPVITGKVGSAQSRLIRQREIVDFTAHWLDTHNKNNHLNPGK